MKKLKLTPANLSMFEGGAAGAAAAGTASTGGEAAGAQGETTGNRVNTQRGKKGAFNNVIYGKQDNAASAAEKQTTTNSEADNTLENRRKAFKDLTNGEYKDIYAENVQSIIDRRFKETKQLQQTVDQYSPIMTLLMERYGIEDGDVSKLLTAVENDDAYWNDAAYEAGMEVEQYKRFKKMERENKAFAEAERQRKGKAQADAQIQKWYSEAENLAAKYPNFDLNAEVQNPQFISLLRSGIPMEHAYNVIHMDEIVAQNATAAAQNAEKKIVDNIRAKGARVAENGTNDQSAFIVKDDVSKLTKKDRAEIVKRVSRGEKIVF